MLQHETPLEYKLIKTAVKGVPNADFIETLAYISGDSLFHEDRFWNALREYRDWGLRPHRSKKTNANIELYYIRYRKRKGILSSPI